MEALTFVLFCKRYRRYHLWCIINTVEALSFVLLFPANILCIFVVSINAMLCCFTNAVLFYKIECLLFVLFDKIESLSFLLFRPQWQRYMLRDSSPDPTIGGEINTYTLSFCPQWQRYMLCDGSPDPTIGGEINTYTLSFCPQWQRYMLCDGSPDPTIGGEINTYTLSFCPQWQRYMLCDGSPTQPSEGRSTPTLYLSVHSGRGTCCVTAPPTQPS